jgi:hypothetical protein
MQRISGRGVSAGQNAWPCSSATAQTRDTSEPWNLITGNKCRLAHSHAPVRIEPSSRPDVRIYQAALHFFAALPFTQGGRGGRSR